MGKKQRDSMTMAGLGPGFPKGEYLFPKISKILTKTDFKYD
jgi:hypothetical protein